MFPFFDNLAFWAFIAAMGAVGYFTMRKHVHKQIAMAPRESLRNPAQRALHRTSIVFVVLPLAYVGLIDGEPFWAAGAVLATQAGLMGLLQLLGVGYAIRLWMLLPITAASIIAGAAAAAWPSVEPSALATAPWLFLILAAAAFALSAAFSLYSFPIGYGERAR